MGATEPLPTAGVAGSAAVKAAAAEAEALVGETAMGAPGLAATGGVSMGATAGDCACAGELALIMSAWLGPWWPGGASPIAFDDEQPMAPTKEHDHSQGWR